MKKTLDILKLSLSSKFLWPSLILAYLFFNFTNYFLMKYIYGLMLVKTKYLFFWYPDYYFYVSPQELQGPQPVTRIFIFIFMVGLLRLTNFKKTTSSYWRYRAFVFVVIYLIISSPSRNNEPKQVFSYLLHHTPSPIENYMRNTKRNFITGYVSTPLGEFKMYKSENYDEDRLSSLETQCRKNIEVDEHKYCYDYPFRPN